MKTIVGYPVYIRIAMSKGQSKVKPSGFLYFSDLIVKECPSRASFLSVTRFPGCKLIHAMSFYYQNQQFGNSSVLTLTVEATLLPSNSMR